MLGIIHHLLSDFRCYRRLLGGRWYHVEVIVFDMVVSGWVQKPEPCEEITKEEDYTLTL
jgi:hypothetical protein